MYIDVIILLVLLLLSIFIFRKFSSFIYSIALIDIFLRIIYYIATHLPINLGDVTNYIITYEEKDNIDGFEFVYFKRDLLNMLEEKDEDENMEI